MKLKTKLNESVKVKKILSEGLSESCSREQKEAYRFIFNINPAVKKIYKQGIVSILKVVYSDNYYDDNEYGEGEYSGVYDLEDIGRSVINYLNTNYNGFCILVNDINKLLRSQNEPLLQFVGETPKKQIEEVKRMVSIMEKFKFRIFSTNSNTFKNLIATLGKTSEFGNVRETVAISLLRKVYGEKNVYHIGGPGIGDDMNLGVDALIKFEGKNYTAQIKGYKEIDIVGDNYIIKDTGQVKEYKTNWMIFVGVKKNILVFDNSNTSIVDGEYSIPVSNLINKID